MQASPLANAEAVLQESEKSGPWHSECDRAIVKLTSILHKIIVQDNKIVV